MAENSDVSDGPRLVVEPLPLPRVQSVDRLGEELIRAGFTDGGAVAIANAVCEPAAFRRAMQSPLTVRVPNGTLLVVATRLWTPAVVPHPTNTRISPWTTFAASGLDARERLARPVANPEGAAELIMRVADRAALVGAMAEAAARLEVENNLDEDIAADGIREAITVVVATVTHADGSEPVELLFAADGSSRVSAAHRNLSVDADAALYRYGTSGRLLRQRVGRSLALLGDGPLNGDDVAELNSLTVPAMVIVGFRPDGSDADFARAVDARVGNIHVHPPKAWSDAARFDAQLNAVIDELADGYLDETGVAYLAGDLSPEQAREAGFTALPDVRAADALADLHNPEIRRSIHSALRNVGGRSVNYVDRADVAAEAALRGFRMEVSSQEATLARTLLRHLYKMSIFRPDGTPWSVRHKLSLDDLRDEALAEAKGAGEQHAIPELLAYAVFWMARLGLVRRATRSGDEDRTDIASVIRQMSTSQWGIRVLHRIVTDARSGRRPRRCGRAGRLIKDDDGNDLFVDESWIREQWGEAGGDDEIVVPEAQLAALRDELETTLRLAAQVLERFTEPRAESGQALAEEVGVPPEWAHEQMRMCNEIVGELAYYQRIGARSHDQ